MDVQHLLQMEIVFGSNSGFTSETLANWECGVFMGCCRSLCGGRRHWAPLSTLVLTCRGWRAAFQRPFSWAPGVGLCGGIDEFADGFGRSEGSGSLIFAKLMLAAWERKKDP